LRFAEDAETVQWPKHGPTLTLEALRRLIDPHRTGSCNSCVDLTGQQHTAAFTGMGIALKIVCTSWAAFALFVLWRLWLTRKRG
jgi:hypothetical protein